MIDIKVGVVILNYKAYQETLDCVKCFKLQTYKNIEIIVVENGSNNESVSILSNEYKDSSNVHIIISQINLGFAKGNNLGIKYARNTLKCDSVIVINSDTLVEPTLVSELVNAMEPQVAVISPEVIHVDGKRQAPAVNTSNMLKELLKTIYKIFVTNLLESIFFRKLYSKYRNNKKINFTDISLEKQVVNKYFLQGCSYMLTNEFFNHYKQLYPKTFLYWEELNLLWYIYRAGLKTKYIDTAPIIHKVAVSTKYLVENKEQKKRRKQYIMDGMKKSIPLYLSSYKAIIRKYN
ncbi:glycosyltransferase [Thomasclavelia sp.]